MKLSHVLILCSPLVLLGGCQLTSAPTGGPKPVVQKPATKPTTPQQVATPPGVKITPYEQAEITRERLEVVVPKQQAQPQHFDDGSALPAFKHLMQQTQTAFKQGKMQDAQNAATHAQRLAPQSAESYLYLAMIANHNQQASNAESLARRGLSYAQSNAMKKQLWQVIVTAAQQQNNQKVLQEARLKLKGL